MPVLNAYELMDEWTWNHFHNWLDRQFDYAHSAEWLDARNSVLTLLTNDGQPETLIGNHSWPELLAMANA